MAPIVLMSCLRSPSPHEDLPKVTTGKAYDRSPEGALSAMYAAKGLERTLLATRGSTSTPLVWLECGDRQMCMEDIDRELYFLEMIQLAPPNPMSQDIFGEEEVTPTDFARQLLEAYF